MKEDEILNKIEVDTRTGKMIWQHNTIPLRSIDGHKYIGYVYTIPVKDGIFRIFKYEYQTYNAEYSDLYWVEDICMEIIDDNGNQKHLFGKNRKIYDIYTTIQFKTENMQEFMDNFLEA